MNIITYVSLSILLYKIVFGILIALIISNILIMVGTLNNINRIKKINNKMKLRTNNIIKMNKDLIEIMNELRERKVKSR